MISKLYPVSQQVKSKPSAQLQQPKKLQTKIKYQVQVVDHQVELPLQVIIICQTEH